MKPEARRYNGTCWNVRANRSRGKPAEEFDKLLSMEEVRRIVGNQGKEIKKKQEGFVRLLDEV
jgi:hypothetical protein